MKNILSIAAFVLLIGCSKPPLQPDPAPPHVPPVENVDTTRVGLVPFTWNCYQYKYTYNNALWLMQTKWKMQFTMTEMKIDELNDGTFEHVHTYKINDTGTEVVIDFPTGSTAYEVRPTRVGQKPGYDLISTGSADPHVYSLVK